MRLVPGALIGVALVLATSAGCVGQGDGADGPQSATARPSVSQSVTRTPVRPSSTRSALEPTVAPPSKTPERPTPTEVEPSPTRSTPDETRTMETTATTETAQPSPTPSQPAEEQATQEADDDGAWAWWVLGLLALAAVVVLTVVLGRRGRKRADWAAGLNEAIGEATWLSRDLVPTLQGQDAAGRSGVWGIGRTRVLRLERTLEGLGGQARDPQTARRCAALTSAVQTLRSVFDQAEVAGDVGAEATTTALRQAQHELDDAIAALQTPRGGGG